MSKFKYYLISVMDMSVRGTNDKDVAYDASYDEDGYIIIDTARDLVIISGLDGEGSDSFLDANSHKIRNVE